MTKNDRREAYEKLLSANHGRMIDFSKFAEAKNAALLTFCSIWIGAIITILRSTNDLQIEYQYSLSVVLVLLFIAAVVSLKSLMPRFLEHMHKREDDYKNLLYFGDITKVGTRDYPGMVADRYTPCENQSATETYLHDLAVQTAIHAGIAHRKFRMFNWAGTFVLVAFGVMAIPPIIFGILWAISHLPC